MATGPEGLTVVVIPLLGGDELAACLDSLPLRDGGMECVVVLRDDMTAHSTVSWTGRYPSVTFLDGGARPVPLRRQLGVEAARGAVVALIEDTTRPDPGWCDAIRAAFADPSVAAAGGPVRIAAGLPSRFQALGWSEYGTFQAKRFLRLAVDAAERGDKLAAGRPIGVTRLPGNNIAFRRAALHDLLRPGGIGLVEGEVCDALRARGHRLLCQPAMSVTYAAPDRHGAALATRLRHGRIYGAARVEGRGWMRRFAFAAKAMLLPGVLSARTLSAMGGGVRPAAVPSVALWVGLMESAWALGEAVGALAGAGDSLEAWR